MTFLPAVVLSLSQSDLYLSLCLSVSVSLSLIPPTRSLSLPITSLSLSLYQFSPSPHQVFVSLPTRSLSLPIRSLSFPTKSLSLPTRSLFVSTPLSVCVCLSLCVSLFVSFSVCLFFVFQCFYLPSSRFRVCLLSECIHLILIMTVNMMLLLSRYPLVTASLCPVIPILTTYGCHIIAFDGLPLSSYPYNGGVLVSPHIPY